MGKLAAFSQLAHSLSLRYCHSFSVGRLAIGLVLVIAMHQILFGREARSILAASTFFIIAICHSFSVGRLAIGLGLVIAMHQILFGREARSIPAASTAYHRDH